MAQTVKNCCAVICHLRSLQIDRFSSQTGLPGSYLPSRRNLKQHAPHQCMALGLFHYRATFSRYARQVVPPARWNCVGSLWLKMLLLFLEKRWGDTGEFAGVLTNAITNFIPRGTQNKKVLAFLGPFIIYTVSAAATGRGYPGLGFCVWIESKLF